MSEASVKISNLVKTYTDARGRPVFTAVMNISFDIAAAELMVLVGPSGCGKSTTLRMVAGLEDISSGTIEIEGEVVNDLEPKDRHRYDFPELCALSTHNDLRKYGLWLEDRPKGQEVHHGNDQSHR